ncbi:hypothetical protein H9P43_008981 [Blastocladiella emersonii ATCC 22665]|nr:hypothetical protein H9P43_008981 [Blastocladiella emersonii ATCC 22665]
MEQPPATLNPAPAIRVVPARAPPYRAAADLGGLVWDPRAVLTLRSTWRVPGTLIGTVRRDRGKAGKGAAAAAGEMGDGMLPDGGLPLYLGPAEVVYLLSQGAITLAWHDGTTEISSPASLLAALALPQNSRNFFAPSFRAEVAVLSSLHGEPLREMYTAHPGGYGCTMLAYQDDPMTCHAAATVHAVAEPSVDLREWVAAARVGSATQKRVVYGAPAGGDGEVGDW